MSSEEENSFLNWFDSLPSERQRIEGLKFFLWTLTNNQINLETKQSLISLIPSCTTIAVSVPPDVTEAIAHIKETPENISLLAVKLRQEIEKLEAKSNAN